jgi:antitoxin component YwqK of YwqJK toxin-antitoxin module
MKTIIPLLAMALLSTTLFAQAPIDSLKKYVPDPFTSNKRTIVQTGNGEPLQVNDWEALRAQANSKFTGTITTTITIPEPFPNYPEGKVRMQFIDGVPHGEWIVQINPPFTPWFSGRYEKGVKTGTWVSSAGSANGDEYILTELYKNGKREGKWSGENRDAGIFKEGAYKQGEKAGKWTYQQYYAESGTADLGKLQHMVTETYKKGKLVKCIKEEYHMNGKLKSKGECAVTNGNCDPDAKKGKWKYYDEQGKLLKEEAH